MNKIKLILSIALTGVLVALTYHLFESSIHWTIDKIWLDIFDTDNNRILVFPLAIIFGLAYFGLQHSLDKSSEKKEEHGLGNAPNSTLYNLIKVLLIGFFSLLAGASLGPEAILVPASMIIGGLVSSRLMKGQAKASKAVVAAGIIALFTAFFNSIIIGILSLFLVLKQAKVKFNIQLLIVAVISSVTSYLTLTALEGSAYAELPNYGWDISLATLVISIILISIGYYLVNFMGYIIKQIDDYKKKIKLKWWQTGFLAGLILGFIYLLGGPLVEFTGNQSIVPMFEQASSLGVAGLIWILMLKVLAVCWSKSAGYRGGMIFPTIFLAAVLSAIAQTYVSEFNVIYGIIAVIIGALISNKNNHTLV